MTGRVPAWVVRAVLALYPADVRQRYGPEIADLLADSPTPWRDVLDVARCALLDTGATMTMAAVRPYAGRLTALLAAPAMFWSVLVALTPIGVFLAAALGTLAGGGSVEFAGGGISFGPTGDDVVAVAALPLASLVAAAVVWQTTRTGDMLRVPAPAVVVPTMLALGSVIVGWLPAVLNPQTHAGWLAVPVATACWWPPVTVVAIRAQRLFAQGRAASARKLTILGTMFVLPLPWTVYLAMLASDPGLTPWGDFTGFRGFGSLPMLLTVGTPFTFTVLSAARPRQPA